MVVGRQKFHSRSVSSLPSLDLLLFSDVSAEGWGVHLEDLLILGEWSHQDKKTPHKCVGAEGSILSIAGVSGEGNVSLCSFDVGQHYTSGICKQAEGLVS